MAEESFQEFMSNLGAIHMAAKEARLKGKGLFPAMMQGFVGAAGVQAKAADPYFALKSTLLRQESEKMNMNLADIVFKRQVELEDYALKLRQREGLTKLAQETSDAMAKGTLGTPAEMQSAFKIMADTGLTGTPEANNLMTLHVNAMNVKQGQINTAEFLKAIGTGGVTLTPTAAPTPTVTTPSQWGLAPLGVTAPAPTTPPTAAIAPPTQRQWIPTVGIGADGKMHASVTMATPSGPSDISKLLAEQQAAIARGDTNSARVIEQHIAKLNAVTKGMKVYDSQGNLIMETGGETKGDLGKPTVATQSRFQQDITKYAANAALSREILDSTVAADVGVAGWAGEAIFDQLLSQINPSAANPQRMDARTKLKFLQEGVLRQVSEDQRFSAQDRKVITEIMGFDKPWKSFPQMQTSLRIFRQIQRERTREAAVTLGMPVPLFARTIPEIVSAKNRGEITAAQAEEALVKYFTSEEAMAYQQSQARTP